MQSEEETRKILKDANELYSQKKYGTAINLLKGLTMEKIPTNLIPYVLELQIRNYMSLLQFKTALKILKESLKFMPNLRDFLLKKVECEFVLNDKDAIKQSIEKLRNNLKENSKGLSPDQALEHSKIGESLNQMERLINEQKERDLTKIRVCFKGSGFVNKTVKLDNNLLSKGVIFSQNDQSLEVVFSKHKIENLNDVKVNFHIKNVIISYPAKGESEGVFFLDLDLYAEICPEKSKFELNQEGKLMAILVKKTEGEYWESLCSFVAEVETQDDTGLTNTAKNWDKICHEFEEDEERLNIKEGDSAMNLFKEIYANANEETKRAMMKSYMTSGGTVLSTNWGEVKDKDYEGKDRPDAPDGQEWKKWET